MLWYCFGNSHIVHAPATPSVQVLTVGLRGTCSTDSQNISNENLYNHCKATVYFTDGWTWNLSTSFVKVVVEDQRSLGHRAPNDVEIIPDTASNDMPLRCWEEGKTCRLRSVNGSAGCESSNLWQGEWSTSWMHKTLGEVEISNCSGKLLVSHSRYLLYHPTMKKHERTASESRKWDKFLSSGDGQC